MAPIYTTVGDLARFAAFLMDQGPESVLKSATLEAFRTEMMVPANVGLTSGYGIGFDVERPDGYVAFEHRGAVAGYTSMLIINRAKGIGVIVLPRERRIQPSSQTGLSTSYRSERQVGGPSIPHQYRGIVCGISSIHRSLHDSWRKRERMPRIAMTSNRAVER